MRGCRDSSLPKVVQFVLSAMVPVLAACGGGGAVDARNTIADAPSSSFVRLDVTPSSAVVAVGATIQLAAVPRDAAGGRIEGLAAPSYRTNQAAIATVDPLGMVTGVAPGDAVITASLTSGGVTRTASAIVSVTATAASPRTVRTPGVSFDPGSLSIAAGDTVTWEFSGAVHNVTFTGAQPPGGHIGDQAVGAVVRRVFPAAGTFAYECTRHAGMVGEVVVRSGTPTAYTSLAVSPASPSITVGDTIRLTASPRDQHGTVMTGLPAAAFLSADVTVATVDAEGLVTGRGEGTTRITASVTYNGATHTAAATVTVAKPVSGAATVTTPNLRFSPQSVTIPIGGTVTWQFSESVHNVTFASGSPAGGSIGDQSPGTSASRTFATAGTYAYECTRHNGMVGEVVVQGDGGPAKFSGVSVTPGQWAMRQGAAKQITASPVDQNGLPMTGLPQPVFASRDPGVVKVSASGGLTAVTEGTAGITATITSDGVTHTATATITVVPGSAAIVTIGGGGYSPDRVQIAPGGTVIWEVLGSTHNMTFDVVPRGGNIPDMKAGNAVARTFATEGDYDYECTLHGEKGRVRVR